MVDLIGAPCRFASETVATDPKIDLEPEEIKGNDEKHCFFGGFAHSGLVLASGSWHRRPAILEATNGITLVDIEPPTRGGSGCLSDGSLDQPTILHPYFIDLNDLTAYDLKYLNIQFK